MRRLLPRTLRGQLVLVILATFIVVQGVSLWLFVDERQLAVRAALGLEVAGRAANVVRLLEATPPELHRDILEAANSPLVRFSQGPAPAIDHVEHDGEGNVARRIHALLADTEPREVRVELHRIDQPSDLDDYYPNKGRMQDMHRRMMGANLGSTEMRLAIAMRDGTWLNVSTRFHRPPIQWPWFSALSYALTTLLILAIVWVALSRLTGPLRRLADAAERFGRGEEVAPLPKRGPEELHRLTGAFNEMQARISRSIAERTRLLAALGHDLRSPLTAMRVRAEMVDDEETRERLTAIIAEMQEMVESTLSFARGMVTAEETQSVDMGAWLGELVSDARTMGGEVSLDAPEGLMARIKPVAMRRALRNVIENALRYGGRAEVTLRARGDSLRISVRDHGPGIPEADLERVFDPFVRLETSRSKETGGTGLGLSIARTIIHAHGGEITLTNRPEGGLEVVVSLPRTKGSHE